VSNSQDPMFGLPGLGGGGGGRSPVDAARKALSDAVAWLKREPEDDFTADELMEFFLASQEFSADGDFDQAIGRLRRLLAAQERRRKAGIRKKLAALLRRRKRSTAVRNALATLLNLRTTQRANEAFEEYQKKAKRYQRVANEDLIERLRGMVHSSPALPMSDPQHERLARLSRQHGFPSLGLCEVCCNAPAVGELRGAGGKATKICQPCANNAETILKERRSLASKQQQDLRNLKKRLDQFQRELGECLAVDPSYEPAQTNLKTLEKHLFELNKVLKA